MPRNIKGRIVQRVGSVFLTSYESNGDAERFFHVEEDMEDDRFVVALDIRGIYIEFVGSPYSFDYLCDFTSRFNNVDTFCSNLDTAYKLYDFFASRSDQ